MRGQSEKDKAPTVGAVGALNVKTQVITQGLNVPNSTEVPLNRAITVPFHGVDLYIVECNGQPYTPLKPIVKGMGLTWHGQHAKLKASAERWGILNLRIPTSSGVQEMICAPLRKLFGWLASIEPAKVNSREARAKVIQYQNECDDVLWQYWNEGAAINVRQTFAANPGGVLTKGEVQTLRLMLKTAAERLPKQKQVALMMQGWGKLRSHFKVSYRAIPRHAFSEAVSIIARHTAEWEVVNDGALPAAADTDKIKHAFTLAAEVAKQAAMTVFNAVVDDKDAHRHDRWMFHMNWHTNDGNPAPWAKPIAHDSVVFSMKELPKRIVEPNSMIGTREELANVAIACMQKLSGVGSMKIWTP